MCLLQAPGCFGAALGARAEPGQSQPVPEPFPCSIVAEQDSKPPSPRRDSRAPVPRQPARHAG